MIMQRKGTENPGQVRQRNEQLILDSAEVEFSQHGYEGATIKSIADRAGLPKANVHYYFKSKLELYGAVLEQILEMWHAAFDGIDIHSDPAQVLEAYVRAKVAYSKNHARASRLFSCEMISGAPYLSSYLKGDFRHWINEKSKLIHYWIKQGKIADVNPLHLLMMIWGASQYLADCQVQVEAAMNKAHLTDDDYEAFADSLVEFVLKSCGLASVKKVKPLHSETSVELVLA